MRAKWFCAVSLALCAVPLPAQKPTTVSANKHPKNDPLPIVKLAFSQEKGAPQGGGLEMSFGEIASSPDGAVFFEAWPPLAPQATSLFSVAMVKDTHTITSYAMDKITDLHDVQLRAFYATESRVALLVYATADDAMSTSKRVIVVPSTGEQYEQSVKSGARHDYIATFDRQGNYKEAVELDLPFRPRRVAVFDSDLYLLIGYDTENKPRFAFVNSDGSLQRLLDTEKATHGWERMTEATGLSTRYPEELRGKMPPQFGMAQILSFHDKLLFVLRGMTWILEISPSGLVRRVPIRVPEGLVIDHFVPSDNMWYASFRKYSAGLNEDVQKILYEISPLDGAPVRRFDTDPEPVTRITCEHNGEFRAIAFDDYQPKLLRGTPQN